MKSFTSERYQILEERGYTIIRRRWRSLRTLFLAVFWVAFNVLFMPDHVRSFSVSGLSSALGWLSLTPFLIEIVLTYGLVASFFNKTDILMGRGLVQVKHYPIWCPGNRKLNAHDIKQIYVDYKTTERYDQETRMTKSTTTYYVNARDRRDKDIRLMGNIFDPEEARFIEAEMEKALEIEDEPVPGAV